ncbi:MAG: helix-turn-helix transcriptional regulator [Lawsonibacter sp.]|nr:helix-turn-helix transcriptional regulator [Lawsonibacter sp.]
METKQRLNKYREASGISQERAAEKLNVSRQTISRWENGVSVPSTENLAKLSELYHVPVDALIKDLEEPFELPEQKETAPPAELPELSEQEKGETPPAEAPPGFTRRRVLVLAGLATILLAVVVAGVLHSQGRNEPPVSNHEMKVEVIDPSTALHMPFIPFE